MPLRVLPSDPERRLPGLLGVLLGGGMAWANRKVSRIFGGSNVNDILLTPSDVATRLGVSVAWVRDHASRKYPKLPCIKVGALLRFHPADIDKWIEDLRAQALRRAS